MKNSEILKLSFDDLMNKIRYSSNIKLTPNLVFELYKIHGKKIFENVYFNTKINSKYKYIIDKFIKDNQYDVLPYLLKYHLNYKVTSLNEKELDHLLIFSKDILPTLLSSINENVMDNKNNILVKIFEKKPHEIELFRTKYNKNINKFGMIYYLKYDFNLDEFDKYFDFNIFISSINLQMTDESNYFELHNYLYNKLTNDEEYIDYISKNGNILYKSLLDNKEVSNFIKFIYNNSLYENKIFSYNRYDDIFKYIIILSGHYSKHFELLNVLEKIELYKQTYNFINNLDNVNLSDKDKFMILKIYKRGNLKKRFESLLKKVDDMVTKIVNQLDKYNEYISKDHIERIENIINNNQHNKHNLDI